MKSELQKSKTKADKYFSLYVRQRDSINEIAKCCTCGERHHWRQMDAGHFMSRRYEATRYDEKNTGPQCRACNRFNQGRQYEFSLYLNKRYGPKTAENITMKSKMYCNKNRFDYESIAERFKNKLKILLDS